MWLCHATAETHRDDVVTAAGKGQLRGFPLAKLKKYAKDYNINVQNVLEKNELIDRLVADIVRYPVAQ